MGFKALFDREDVLEILKQTLEDYYLDKTGKIVRVEYSNRKSRESFILIPKLGMISRPFPCKEIKKHFYDDYNIRGNVIKNLGAKIMIFLATHSIKFFSLSKCFYIIPCDIISDKTIFAFCNRTVRVFDYDSGTTVSIQKKGFSDKYFRQHLMFRLNNDYDFIPPMLSHGENWIEEKILSGVMLARVTDKIRYDQSVECVLNQMKVIADDTIKHIGIKNYALQLIEYIEHSLNEALEIKQINSFNFAKQYVALLKNQTINLTGEIPTVESHGDLQGGNVLVSKDKIWIIDWETAERRSSWYDVITLQFETRYYGGIKRLTKDCLYSDIRTKLTRLYDCTLAIKDMILIYLLEDMTFYLEDMLELPNKAGRISFDNYMQEISEINWKDFFSIQRE